MCLPNVAFVVLAFAHAACCARLPSTRGEYVDAPDASEAHGPAKWWAHVGDRVYYQPPSFLGLSQNISHYYVARGSASALTDELRDRLVASHDRWHIFHVPENAHSLLQAASKLAKGGRRSSLSALKQLEHGRVYGEAAFPIYSLSPAYTLVAFGLGTGEATAERNGMAHITEDSVRSFLQGLVDLGTRSALDDTARSAAEDHVLGEFNKLAERTCKHEFHRSGKDLHNVVAYIPGQSETQGFVIMGAHFDSRPFSGPAPGANDNGSGVAAMLAAMQALKEVNMTPEKPIYFVAFAGEEEGLWGSDAFVEAFTSGTGAGLERIGCTSSGSSASFLASRARTSPDTSADNSFAIILDEVGWVSTKLGHRTINMETYDEEPGRNTTPIMQHLAASLPDTGADLTVVHSDNPFGSDHMSFLEKSIPAVLIINGDDEGYPEYHKSTDQITQVNMGYLADVAKLAFGGLFRLAFATESQPGVQS